MMDLETPSLNLDENQPEQMAEYILTQKGNFLLSKVFRLKKMYV
jgi:hypothetical protein